MNLLRDFLHWHLPVALCEVECGDKLCNGQLTCHVLYSGHWEAIRLVELPVIYRGSECRILLLDHEQWGGPGTIAGCDDTSSLRAIVSLWWMVGGLPSRDPLTCWVFHT